MPFNELGADFPFSVDSRCSFLRWSFLSVDPYRVLLIKSGGTHCGRGVRERRQQASTTFGSAQPSQSHIALTGYTSMAPVYLFEWKSLS